MKVTVRGITIEGTAGATGAASAEPTAVSALIIRRRRRRNDLPL